MEMPVEFEKEIKGLRDDVNIKSIADNSDASIRMSRMRIVFNNGHELSVVRGLYSYGGDKCLFEIMPSDADHIDNEDCGDDVVGYLTAARVEYYISKIGEMK